MRSISLKRHRFPAAVIRHAVWLYFRFTLRHLDEMVCKVGGMRMYLWRAVHDEGEVLDLVMQRVRDTDAALKLLKRLLRNQPVEPETITTDGLGSVDGVAKQDGPDDPLSPLVVASAIKKAQLYSFADGVPQACCFHDFRHVVEGWLLGCAWFLDKRSQVRGNGSRDFGENVLGSWGK
jgi:hypothetical protein